MVVHSAPSRSAHARSGYQWWPRRRRDRRCAARSRMWRWTVDASPPSSGRASSVTPRKRSMRPVASSRPDSSTSTAITTVRPPGTRCSSRRRCTESPPSSSATAVSDSPRSTQDRHDWLIELMEGVEDIPGAALDEGITWGWESFPEYLDVLDRHPARHRHRAPRCRTERCADMSWASAGRPSEAADRRRDRCDGPDSSREAVEAGAVGFSTNRLEGHRSKSGMPVPGTYAEESELSSIVGAMSAAGGGTVEWVPNGGIGGFSGRPRRPVRHDAPDLPRQTGRPTIFQVNQRHTKPDGWRRRARPTSSAWSTRACRAYPQVHGRGFCLLFGFDTTLPSVQVRASSWRRWRRCRSTSGWTGYATLPYAPASSPRARASATRRTVSCSTTWCFRWATRRSTSRAATSRWPPSRSRRPPVPRGHLRPHAANRRPQPAEPANRQLRRATPGRDGGNASPIRSPCLGGSDGGAHCATASDASMPTFMLTHWVRDRPTGRLPLELVVHKMSGATAEVYGMHDRGVIAPGKKADLNVIDLDRLGAASADDALRPTGRRQAARPDRGRLRRDRRLGSDHPPRRR